MKTIRQIRQAHRKQAHGKIGIFDSGVGGLLIARAIQKKLPQYDYVYLGDTKRVPYGNRSHETVFEYTREAVDYLFKKENCALVILACNTASARALRKLQSHYAKASRDKQELKVLGVLIPAVEECEGFKKIGVLATRGTVTSNTFVDEIKKINPKAKVFQNPAPMLVPLAEEGEVKLAIPFIKKYLKPLLSKKVEAVVLGCTHYPFFKKEIKKILLGSPKHSEGGVNKTKLVSQDEVVPRKLKEYLAKHSEIESVLSKGGSVKLLFTDITPHVSTLSGKWFHKGVKPEKIELVS